MFIHFEQMLRFTMFFKCCYILNMLNVHYEIINKSPRFEIQVAEQSVQNLCNIYAKSIQHQCKIDSRGERADPAGVGVRFLHRGQVPPSELCPGVLRTLVVLLRSLCRTSEKFGLGFWEVVFFARSWGFNGFSGLCAKFWEVCAWVLRSRVLSYEKFGRIDEKFWPNFWEVWFLIFEKYSRGGAPRINVMWGTAVSINYTPNHNVIR